MRVDEAVARSIVWCSEVATSLIAVYNGGD